LSQNIDRRTSIRAGAGNDAEAGRAATKGFTTAAAMAAGAAGTMTGGPAAGVAAGLATGAALTPAADEVHKAIENEKNKNKG